MVQKKEPFELIEHLGTGGFAQTWRARVIDPDLLEEWGETEVAIKIPLTKQKERALRKDIEHAGTLHMQLTKVESKNLVKYLGFEIFEGKLVMVMEYVKGGNLRSIIGRPGRWKRIEVKRAVTIAEGILNGLSVMHKKHIVHRDIKPENILMDGETPKIADMGIARMLRTNELASSGAGTLFYMSPESLYYEEPRVSFNTDIWSLGITLYEMLYGQFSFGIDVEMPAGKVMSLIKDESVRLVFPDDVTIPSQLQNIISKSLAKDRNSRYKTADEMLKDIRKFLKGVNYLK